MTDEKIKKLVEQNFRMLEQGKEWEYDLYFSYDEYLKVIKMGKTYKEKLQIFMMLYIANVTVEELNSWTLAQLIDYIKETDEYFEEFRAIIMACAMEVIGTGNDDTIKVSQSTIDEVRELREYDEEQYLKENEIND